MDPRIYESHAIGSVLCVCSHPFLLPAILHCAFLYSIIGMNKQKLADKVNLGTSPRKILISLPLNVRKCKGPPLTRE